MIHNLGYGVIFLVFGIIVLVISVRRLFAILKIKSKKSQNLDLVRETEAKITKVITYKYLFLKVSKNVKYTYFVEGIPYKGDFGVSPKTELSDTFRIKYLVSSPKFSVPSEHIERVFRSMFLAILAGLGLLSFSYYFLYDFPFWMIFEGR